MLDAFVGGCLEGPRNGICRKLGRMRQEASPETHEPVEGINPFDGNAARRFGWALLVWGTAIWPFYIIAVGLPLFGAHTLLVIASVIAYVVAGARLIMGAESARQSQYLIFLAKSK